jgi:hypothetical protein
MLDHAYRFLLSRLSLSDSDRIALRDRGVPDEEFGPRGYRSFPLLGRLKVAQDLRAHLGSAVFRSIPGFRINNDKPSLGGPVGPLIPCRNAAGQIVALKVRQDDEPDNKYVYVSSTKHAGPGPGCPPHVPLGTNCPVDRVRLTEGELKAGVVSVLDDLPTISAPGVTNWRPCIVTIKELGAKVVVLSMDPDAARKPQVARAVRACADTKITTEARNEFLSPRTKRPLRPC